MAATSLQKTETENVLAEMFRAQGLTNDESEWARSQRGVAWDAFLAKGLPHRRIEQWKYTDLRNLLGRPPKLAAGRSEITQSHLAEALGVDLDAFPCHRLVFTDGLYRADLSNIDASEAGLEVHRLKDMLAQPPQWFQETFGQVNDCGDNPIVALNTAFMRDGAVIRVAAEREITKPVHLVFLTTAPQDESLAVRNLIDVGERAKLTILETYAHLRAPAPQSSCVTELVARDKAEVHHIKFQNEAAEATHLSHWTTRLGAHTRYKAFQYSLGAKLARNDISVRFAGEHADANISGAFMLWNKQHCDTTLLVDHAVPYCTSRELFKAVLDDESRGIFQGKLIVRPDAQKTDGKQMAQVLLLSERAEFDAKPELEIYADDVACGHGATSGRIDEDLLFYLRSRGIPEEQARTMLITAFIGEALELIEDETLRDALQNVACSWLGCV